MRVSEVRGWPERERMEYRPLRYPHSHTLKGRDLIALNTSASHAAARPIEPDPPPVTRPRAERRPPAGAGGDDDAPVGPPRPAVPRPDDRDAGNAPAGVPDEEPAH